MKLSAAVITLNEERNIADCLKSLDFCDEIVVVDSGSTDRTVEIAKTFTKHVFDRAFKDFADQKNFALSKTSGQWILSVDADERVSGPLKAEILELFAAGPSADAYRIPRQTFYLGRRFRFSGTQDDKPLRLFKHDAGRFKQPIHEFFDTARPVATLKAPLVHRTTRSIREEVEKTAFYTDLETRFLIEKGRRVGFVERKLRAAGIFAYHYFWKLGFLDGWQGFLFAYYARGYTRAKYKKLAREIRAKNLEQKIGARFNEHAPHLPDRIDRSDNRLAALLEACGDVRRKKVLEVGCGKGRFAEVMIERGADLAGVDPSAALLDTAKRLRGGRFLLGTASELPFEKGSFDVVYAVEVIEHLPDLEAALREMARVLKPGGRLVLVDRNKYSINHKRFLAPNWLVKTWHEIKNDWMYPRGFPFREKWFSCGQVARAMRPYFGRVSADFVMSDGEKKCAWRGVFERVPASRLFILWSGVKK